MQSLTLSQTRELEYLNWVVYESMRTMPPASASTTMHLVRDTTLGGVKM